MTAFTRLSGLRASWFIDDLPVDRAMVCCQLYEGSMKGIGVFLAKSELKKHVPRFIRARFRDPYLIYFDKLFADREAFETFIYSHPKLQDDAFIKAAAKRLCSRGAIEPLTGAAIPAHKLEISNGLREGLVHNRLNARQRAVWLALESIIASLPTRDPAIYAPEAITPMAMRLRAVFPRFLGSEYTTDPEQADALYPIPIQDLQALDLRDASFDIVMTNEVLEHVPSIDAALSEIYRVLKVGGVHIGTMPFMYFQNESIVRARMENGRIVHLMEPEYHGNPVDPEGGALAFEIPGWNLLERVRAAGFRHANMRFMLSTNHACLFEGIGGILLLQMTK